MKTSFLPCFITVLLLLSLLAGYGSPIIPVQAPRGLSISMYDDDSAIIRERRAVTVPSGESWIRLRGLPSALDPATVSFDDARKDTSLKLLESQFLFDLSNAEKMFQRYQGKEVTVVTTDGALNGRLLDVPSPGTAGKAPDPGKLVLQDVAGGVSLFPSIENILRVHFPDADSEAYIEPTLLWRVRADADSMQNMLLSYNTSGMSWRAFYEFILDVDEKVGFLSGRIRIRNDSGAVYSNAQVRINATEKGVAAIAEWKFQDVREAPAPVSEALRYMPGTETVTFNRRLGSLTPRYSIQLPEKITLRNRESIFVETLSADKVPVEVYYAYDGVLFDRFQRNRRNDWNYGTESHSRVETFMGFENLKRYGLGQPMLPGMLAAYREREDGGLDLLGREYFAGAAVEDTVSVPLGVAHGLSGERERTGYSEIIPLHEYEESFEIRLSNDLDRDVSVRVFEHLYRWPDFEIVYADSEYEQIAPQTIEFRPNLKAGGRRTVHYTVRYRW